MAESQVLQSEPRHKIAEFVHEMASRRENTLSEMKEEVAGFVTALIDQLMLLKKWNPQMDMRLVTFQKPTWRRTDGVIVFTLLYQGKPLTPQNVRID